MKLVITELSDIDKKLIPDVFERHCDVSFKNDTLTVSGDLHEVIEYLARLEGREPIQFFMTEIWSRRRKMEIDNVNHN
jgi:hypothetical protein